jgi:hypothetical protein
VLDPAAPGEIYNVALAQRGGPTHGADNFASRKHYISGIDFINWNGPGTQHARGLASTLPLDSEALVPAEVLGDTEGGAAFRIAGINDSQGKAIDFGIEVCLDHACSGGNRSKSWGRLRSAGLSVKIQLVPSGGMSLQPQSVRLSPAGGDTSHSYAFNCDGLGTLTHQYGSHTQVWNRGDANGAPVPLPNRLVEASGGVPLAGTVALPLATQVNTAHGPVAANLLWNNGHGVEGAGQVRILKALDL